MEISLNATNGAKSLAQLAAVAISEFVLTYKLPKELTSKGFQGNQSPIIVLASFTLNLELFSFTAVI